MRGNETILVVEDDETVIKIIVEALEIKGYKVFAKTDAKTALAFIREYSGPIHLLLTDVVMPEMNGRQLAEKISASIPGIRVIYMSGYTDNAIAHHGVLNDGIDFIEKPIMIHGLVKTVRSVLDRA